MCRARCRGRVACHLYGQCRAGARNCLPPADCDGRPVARLKGDPAHHDPDHLGHLGLGKSGADAAVDPAAEGQPGVGLGPVVEEALRAELVGLRAEILTTLARRSRSRALP